MINLLLYNAGLQQDGVVESTGWREKKVSNAVCRGEKRCNFGTVVVIEELFTKILSHEPKDEERRKSCLVRGSCEGCPFGVERVG